MARARATSARIESSSSAISTRDMATSMAGAFTAALYTAAGNVTLVEEADVDALAIGRGRSQTRLEPGMIAWLQRGLLQDDVPGVDFRALPVAHREAQPRQLDRLAALADDNAFDHQ